MLKEVLLSGLLGALLATVIGVAFNFFQEQARLRAEIMLAVVGWADDAYLRLIDLQMSKKAAYTSNKPYLAAEEYALNSRELRSLLLRASVPARLAIVYGDGEETLLLSQLRDRLLQAAQMLWGAKGDNWPTVDADVQAFLEKEVEPVREKLQNRLLKEASIPIMWLRLKRKMKRGPN